MAAVADNPFAHLAGHRFPSGTHTLAGYESWLWADAVEAAPDRALAHPGIAYMVAIVGTGAGIAEIFELFEVAGADGVMFGEIEMRFDGVLRPDTAYAIDGEVLAVDRKRGRRVGVFDRATFRHSVREQGATEPVATLTHVWIIPRELA